MVRSRLVASCERRGRVRQAGDVLWGLAIAVVGAGVLWLVVLAAAALAHLW